MRAITPSELISMSDLASTSPLAIAASEAIRAGNVDALKQLLAEHPELASTRILDARCNGGGARTLLHIATDWPGNFPRGAETVVTLVQAGADVNATFGGAHTETPLHWAASCDDVSVLDTLLDHGANIEAPGAVIAGGTPLADAVAFGQWKAARRLIERGARANLWQAAALGLMDRVEESVSADPPPPAEEITKAFWLACHGGQLTAAEHLLARGADINWVGYDDLTPLDTARRSEAADVVAWLESRGAKSAKQ
jgi:ankyrin repeat protein